MHFSGLCRSIFKDVLQTKKTEVFTYIWRNAPKSLCKTSIRNFHCSRIVLQKPPNPRPYFSKHRAGTARNYAVAFLLTALGGTYAAVPLYRLYCQVQFFSFLLNLQCNLTFLCSRQAMLEPFHMM